jgi:flagellin FlaB
MLKKFLNREKGITGLETAIILIAFVVVAAVFAYTALSAGLFSTQKSQEAVYSGLKEAQSTLELRGGVIAVAEI